MTNPILEVRNVSKRFGGVEALRDVSLEVKRGSITGLIGPNGSGKSTLFNVITGFYKPDSGSVYFEGRRIDGLNPNEIYNIGIARTFQIPRLFGSLTTLENMMLSPRGQKGESLLRAPLRKAWVNEELQIANEVKNLLKEFNMDGAYRMVASSLSGGHVKMVETSKGILGRAKLILLDEPTAGVHYAVGRSLFEYISYLRKTANLTFFIIEHRIDLLFDYVDYVYVLHMGRLLSQGTPEEVASDPKVIEAYIGGA
ncbi:MAG: ABC transporter ATP-binding protein [Candidatus Bathyarchaeia archaeon]|nr:ABC transporter ATP-binding protein [Candidatus Bathyarchaeota archaeon]